MFVEAVDYCSVHCLGRDHFRVRGHPVLHECYAVFQSTLYFIDIQSPSATSRGLLGNSHEGLAEPC